MTGFDGKRNHFLQAVVYADVNRIQTHTCQRMEQNEGSCEQCFQHAGVLTGSRVSDYPSHSWCLVERPRCNIPNLGAHTSCCARRHGTGLPKYTLVRPDVLREKNRPDYACRREWFSFSRRGFNSRHLHQIVLLAARAWLNYAPPLGQVYISKYTLWSQATHLRKYWFSSILEETLKNPYVPTTKRPGYHHKYQDNH